MTLVDVQAFVDRYQAVQVMGNDASSKPDRVALNLRAIGKQFGAIGLAAVESQADELAGLIEKNGLTLDLRRDMAGLAKAIRHSLGSVKCLRVQPHRLRFYEVPHAFGTEVWDMFPSAQLDVEEAGKCFALERWSACVFHCTRALEVCLNVLALEVKVTPDQNWNKLIDQVESALRKGLEPPNPKPADWKDTEQFYSDAAAHFRNIKNGWRNPASHAGFSYDEERAIRILNGTEAFMRHLATKLMEPDPQ